MNRKSNAILKTCAKGHEFYKSSACPVCPKCEKIQVGNREPWYFLSAPARRALANHGIMTLEQLADYSEQELLQFHGMGKTSIPKLRSLLAGHALTLTSNH